MPDSNDDLLAALSARAAPSGPSSNEDLLAALNQEPEPDPLADVELTGDPETDAAAELDALHDAMTDRTGFKARAKREAERFLLATDSEYWFCVCFKNREDKDRFLAASKLVTLGDKYLDGYAAARILGVPTETQEGKEG